MKMFYLLLIFGVTEFALAGSFKGVPHKLPKCRPIMANYHLTGRFPGAVSHGIHSITLEDIRHYFKAETTENNGIPTLNYDLSAKETVLPNAPLFGYDTSFQTMGMRYADQVLKNMERKNFYLTSYSPLEQLIHTMHMGEVWARTKVYYDEFASKVWDDNNLCDCVTDIDNNGIMKMLPFMSLKIRYPGLTSGKRLKFQNGGYANYVNIQIYTYSFFNNWSDELDQFDFNQDIDKVLKQAADKLVDHDKGVSHLKTEADWESWKRGMKTMVEHDHYELAMFLYCSLKKK